MKIKLLAVSLGFVSMNMSAQITVLDTDLISIGDVIYQATDTMPSSVISVGNTGPNQNWDFSALQEMEIETIEVVAPVGTLYGSMYPNANLCVEMDDDLLYLDKSSTGVVAVGIADLPVNNVMLIPLPLTFGLTYQDGPNTITDSVFVNTGPFSINNMLTTSISTNPLHDQIDSLKFKVVITKDFNVDAWGNVKIPLGNYDALRMQVEETTTTDYYAYCSEGGLGGGWFSAQALAPIQTEISMRYEWWSNDPVVKFMLAELQVDNSGNVEGASFLIAPPAASVSNLLVTNFNVYPIPATSILTVDAQNNELTSLELVDLNGKVIFKNEFAQSTSLDISQISKGIYFLNLQTFEGDFVKQIIIE